MRRLIATILPLAVLLAACGTDTIKASGAEQSIIDVVSSKTGIKPQNVKCPAGVAAKVKATFDCHFTGPGGTKYTAHMLITKISGNSVDFYITTSVG
jgi:hypothetical protein